MVSYTPWADWINDAAPTEANTWVMVGEAGTIWRSTNDAVNFTGTQTASGVDLYAVSFSSAHPSTGLAVGRAGEAWLTTDGGNAWDDVSTGLDVFLGDVRWLADGTAVVVGEAGTVLRFDPAAR